MRISVQLQEWFPQLQGAAQQLHYTTGKLLEDNHLFDSVAQCHPALTLLLLLITSYKLGLSVSCFVFFVYPIQDWLECLGPGLVIVERSYNLIYTHLLHVGAL